MAQTYTDLTSRIERLAAFEERLEVRLEALHASAQFFDFDGSHAIEVRGEIHCESGMELEDDLEVILSAYDDSGRMTHKSEEHIDSSVFFGFHSFDFFLDFFVGPTYENPIASGPSIVIWNLMA